MTRTLYRLRKLQPQETYDTSRSRCHNSACLLTALATFTAQTQSTCQSRVHLLAVCLGDMGQETMASATINIVRVLNPSVCINTGITGSLNDGDLKIGDVMVHKVRGVLC